MPHGRPRKAATQGGDAKFDAVHDKFVEQVRQMCVQLDELEDSAIHKARRAARTTDLAIQSHPYGAMGIAAAAGLLIGFLAARRWRPRLTATAPACAMPRPGSWRRWSTSGGAGSS